jgi:hypothetical protein
MEWSPSKLIRIEAGTVGISVNDLRALLALYQVTDKQAVESLVQMAREARQRSWLHDYRSVATPKYISYLGYEASASTIRNFQPDVIPGLLQTEDYADEILRYLRGPKTQDRIDTLVRLRVERQERILARENPPELRCILDESTIRRRVGGADTMRLQLEHLKSISQRSNITIRIIPFTHGFYRSIRVPYVVLEFPDPADNNVLFLEYPENDEIIREDSTIGHGEDPTAPPTYLEIFGELERITSDDESRSLIEEAIQAVLPSVSPLVTKARTKPPEAG